MKNKFKRHLSTFFIIFLIILYFYITYWIGTGISQNTNINLSDYTVSEDNTKLTLKLATDSSTGYVRNFSPLEVDNVVYIDFYSTFGGVNSTFGAKDEFDIELSENCQAIYFQRDDGYELVLYLNPETSQWEKISPVGE